MRLVQLTAFCLSSMTAVACAASVPEQGGDEAQQAIAAAKPAKPIAPKIGTMNKLTTDSGVPYFVYASKLYDTTHATPTKALLWLHGCFGNAEDEAWTVSVPGQSWITVGIGGESGKDSCWDLDKDRVKVLSALADVKTRLNIDSRRVVVGGYSSGGDLSYRLAFENGKAFAGVLVENTSPFRDTGLSAQQALALAAAPGAWKPPVTHLAHAGDATYPIATVRAETQALVDAGFALTLITVPGGHWDNDGTETDGRGRKEAFGTVHDRKKYLLPWLNEGWTSPR